MKKIIQFAFILVLVLNITSCQKDLSNEFGDVPNLIASTPKSPIVANLQGIVLDENGAPSEGAVVIVGSKSATTDNKGLFRIKNADLDKLSAMVKIEKAGYFTAYRSFMATAAANNVRIKLTKKQLVGTVNATSGGTATLSNGAKITLQANGIVKKAGGAFTDDVKVYAAYINPTATDIAETIPGSYMADDKTGKRVLLQSYGMLAVELESASGEKLQIAPGKTAELTAPIPTSLLATSPNTIPLWYVDEQTGIWKEQGMATKVGNNYVGNVSHFSFWNYDFPFSSVILTVRATTPNGNPLSNMIIKITSPNYGGYACGISDDNGIVTGLVPANEQLQLSVFINYNYDCFFGPITPIYSQAIPALNQNTNLGNIQIQSTTNPNYTVSGNIVDCLGNIVTNGETVIYIGGIKFYTQTDNTGNFSCSLFKCNSNPLNITILGVDNNTQQQSATMNYTITNSSLHVGNIFACGNNAAQFFNYTVDGTNFSLNSTSNNTFSGVSANWVELRANNGNNLKAFLKYNNTTNTTGVFPIDYCNFNSHYGTSLINTPNSTVTITNAPQAINEFYEGSFVANYRDSSNLNIIHNATGNFRIRRQY